MGTICVAIFFFLSGYGLMKQYLSKGRIYHKTFLKSRFSKLLPAFFIATLLYGCYAIVCNSWQSVLERFINGFPPLPTSWFVYAISYFYLAFYTVGKLVDSLVLFNFWMFAITVVYCSIILFLLNWGGWWVNAIFAMNLGVGIASFESFIYSRISNKTTHIMISVFTVIISIIAISFRQTIIYNLTICFLIWLTFVNRKFSSSLVMDILGRYSYEIYLVQGAVIALLVKYMHINEMFPMIGIIITLICSFLGAYILKNLAAFCLKKHCNG